MQNNHRYVSIQLGIGGWKPENPKKTIRNGYGDCKALSALMIAMLSHYDIKELQTLTMRLRLRGGGCKSRKKVEEPLVQLERSSNTRQLEDLRSAVIAKRRRSMRLNLKRPRDFHMDCASPGRHSYPLCNEDLTEKTTQELGGVVFCC